MKHILFFLLPLSLLFLTSCTGRKEAQYREALSEARRQNLAYEPVTGDSLLRCAVDYFDRHGSANDRLLSRYLLGCAYRDLHEAPLALITWEDAVACADTLSPDCDYATLFRVYGQMADVYNRQHLPEKLLAAENSVSKYAILANDTFNYIRGIELQVNAYYKKIYQNDFGGGLPESREYIDDYKRYNYVDSAWHYVAALRDDGSRVYIFREGAEEEEIYYDLSLKEGESFLLPGGGSGKTAFSAAEIVSINGTPRRKLPWYQWYNTPNGPVAVTSGDHIWLEGIGQNHDGFLRAEWQTSVEGSETVLLAVTDGETCIYGALKNLSAIPQVRTTSSSSPALFDLSGRSLSVPPAKGIYIENGQKRVAKGR